MTDRIFGSAAKYPQKAACNYHKMIYNTGEKQEMAVKLGMISLGCSKNLVDSERMLFKCRDMGIEIVADPADADVVAVNTCGFIQSAKEEAIETILELEELKKEGTIKKIIITGCLAERYKEEIAEEFPAADAVIGIYDQKNIADIVKRAAGGEKVVSFGPKEEAELCGKRIISTLPFYAYIKIAEGCSNNCSYCAIPKIRGKYRSVPFEDIINEAETLAKKGVTEIILIAQDTTRYGEDLYGKKRLPELLEALSAVDGLKWIRVLYTYPERITDELLDVMAGNEKIVRYIDMPLQHCNKEILKRMHRAGGKNENLLLIEHIREKMPDVTLRTTLITGFPGETESDFEELGEFVKEAQFDHLGCFAYSQEEGTEAAGYEGQLDEEIKQHRADMIMEQQMFINGAKLEKKIGDVVEAVVEGYDRYAGVYFARTAADAPDIDGKLFITSKDVLETGKYYKIKITDTMDYDLLGEVAENEPAE